MSAPEPDRMPRASRRRGLLLTRPWLLAALGVLAAMAACILLGLWQFHRYEERSARADRIEANYAAPPVPLTQVLPDPTSGLPTSAQWRTVEVTGEYVTDPEHVLYVRNRTFHGEVGFAQLVPLRTPGGTIMVARGWLPTAATKSTPLSPPDPPDGERTVVLRLRPTEPVLPDRRNPPGQIQSIAAEEFAPLEADLGPLFTGAYGELASEDPDPGQGLTAFERPDTSLGPHLSYAVQWWAFALFFPAAWVVRARRALSEQPDADPVRAATAPPAGTATGSRTTARAGADRPRPTGAPARRRRSRDEEEEDALVENRHR